MSNTNKIHVIEDHVIDYREHTGKTLGQCNDQMIESLHQYLNQRMESSKYHMKNKARSEAGKKLLKAVLHHNAYSIN